MERAARVRLDEIAKQIIEQLQQDGRRSYAAIGKAVGLSEAAVRQRVQKLLDTGVMQIVGVTDPLMLGLSRQMMMTPPDTRRFSFSVGMPWPHLPAYFEMP